MKTIEYNYFLEKVLITDFNVAPLKEAFALKLEYLLLCSNLSIYEFATKINLNYSYLNDVLRGARYISLNKLENIAIKLNMSILDLFDFTPLIVMQQEKCFIKFPNALNVKTI